MRIHTLDIDLANKIAAGEVVERPLSVVKELLENSLDAGATLIQLEVNQGGLSLLKVTDNGSGIHSDDLQLAVSPHATSKIRAFEDLQAIHTLGFRGEALASISAVSRFQLISRSKDQPVAWKISVEGRDTQIIKAPIAHPVGTTIIVEDLFFNTPARRKFLSSERTEYLHIEEMVRRLVLSRFDVGFKLIHHGRQVLNCQPANTESGQQERLSNLLGHSFVEKSIYIEASDQGIKLRGWLASPEVTHTQANRQFIYVNGRAVKDKNLSYAIKQVYSDRIFPGRHPVFVLYLDLPPEQVDVNVHPAKTEIRFQNGRFVRDFMVSQLRAAFNAESKHTSSVFFPETSGEEFIPDLLISPRISEPSVNYQRENSTVVIPKKAEVRWAAAAIITEKAEEKLKEMTVKVEVFRPIAVLDKKVLLAFKGKEWWLVDIVAAQKQTYQENLNALSLPLDSQVLLFPSQLMIDQKASEWVEQETNIWQSLGFDFSFLGKNQLIIRKIPKLFSAFNPAILVEAWLDFVCPGSSQNKPEKPIHELFKTFINTLDFSQLPFETPEQNKLLEKLAALSLSERDLRKIIRPVVAKEILALFAT